MNQINFQNVCHSTNTTSNASKSEIVRELIAGHTVFQEKMIPEIEQHFLVLLVQADQ